MTQALVKKMCFEEFVNWKPSNGWYELHNGVVVEISQPSGKHQEIVAFLVEKFTLEYSRLKLPYGIPKTVLVKPLESDTA